MSTDAASGAQIRAATPADVEPVAQLLAEGFPRTSVAFWRGMLAYPWLPAADKPDLGVLLAVDGEVQGFFGAIYSDRLVNGRRERFCNVFGIYVREAHRRHAMPLIAALVRRPGLTFLNLTPAAAVVPIFTRFGFVPAAARRIEVALTPRAILRGRGGVRVLTDDEVTPATLDAEAYRIHADHFGRSFTRTVVEVGGRTCLLMSKRTYVAGRRWPVVELYHASDRALLREHFDQVALRLLSVHKATALRAEEQVLGFVPPGATFHEATTLYKSDGVPASAIDGLYSELAILP